MSSSVNSIRLAFTENGRAEPSCDRGLGFNVVIKDEPIENMYLLDKHLKTKKLYCGFSVS